MKKKEPKTGTIVTKFVDTAPLISPYKNAGAGRNGFVRILKENKIVISCDGKDQDYIVSDYLYKSVEEGDTAVFETSGNELKRFGDIENNLPRNFL